MIIVIHGAQRTGKTVNAQAFMNHFGATRLVDCWPHHPGRHALRDGDLVLTTELPVKIIKKVPDARIVTINAARAAIGLPPAPKEGFK